MELMLAAGGSLFDIFKAPSLQVIILFIVVFAALNWIEKGRWD
ncbi:hypothetical protein [Parvularcula mediterranea]|nr:hypothetical protein [Parvularcula mediterranea]